MKILKSLAVLLSLLSPLVASAQVPYERVLNSDKEPQNWLTYGGNYYDQRFSGLKQLTPENVARLKLAWAYQPNRPAGNVETSPIVVDGIMYVTEPPSTVTALDAHTGARLWTWSPILHNVVAIGLFQTNRGVAVLDKTVYVATIDAHLVALNATTGRDAVEHRSCRQQDGIRNHRAAARDRWQSADRNGRERGCGSRLS